MNLKYTLMVSPVHIAIQTQTQYWTINSSCAICMTNNNVHIMVKQNRILWMESLYIGR